MVVPIDSGRMLKRIKEGIDRKDEGRIDTSKCLFTQSCYRIYPIQLQKPHDYNTMRLFCLANLQSVHTQGNVFVVGHFVGELDGF
jgi:hypothetical protein